MDRAVYERMAQHDATHWWYVARRKILANLITIYVRPQQPARILEIGCGTGHNFGMLGAFGTVDAIEIDEGARAVAESRLGRPILTAPLPGLDGIPDGSYDMIALLDVLEHIGEDQASLASIRTKLKPGGKILLTTPSPFVRPSLNNTVVPTLRYSGLYMYLNRMEPLSPVLSKSWSMSTTLAACLITPQWITA